MMATKHPRKLVIAAIAIVLSAVLIIQQGRGLLQSQTQANLENLGNTLAKQTALVIAPLMLSQDWVSLNVTLKQLTNEPLLQGASLTGKNKDVITQIGNPTEHLFSHEVKLEETTMGTLTLYFNPDQLALTSQSAEQRFMMVTLTIHLLLLVLAYWLLRATPPIPRMSISSSKTAEVPEPAAQIATEILEEMGSNDILEATTEVEDFDEPLIELNDQPAAADPLPANEMDDNIRFFVIFVNCEQASQHLETLERDQLMHLYQQLFERVCAIYRGALSHDEEGNWLAQFPQQILEDENIDLQHKLHCGSNALCAAQLFKSLYRKLNEQRILQMRPVLNLKIGLVAGNIPAVLQDQAKNLTTRTQSNELIIANSLYEFEALRSLLIENGKVSRSESGCFLIHQLADDFQQLIDRQAEHFLQESLPINQPQQSTLL